jgi:hypothetical protein
MLSHRKHELERAEEPPKKRQHILKKLSFTIDDPLLSKKRKNEIERKKRSETTQLLGNLKRRFYIMPMCRTSKIKIK